MNKIILIALLLFSPIAHADWTKTDTINESILFTTLAVDGLQTMDIKNHEGYYETNPILGRHPSDQKIAAYFITTGFLHYQVAKRLQPKYRHIWQHVWIGIEIGTIKTNAALGIRISL